MSATTVRTAGNGTRPRTNRAAAPDSEPLDTAIDTACRLLHLPTIRDRFEEIASTALREQLTYKEFLSELLDCECADREERRKIRRVREANFPRPKRIEDFDFQANPNITREVINTLADPSWVNAGNPLCLIGDSGTG